MSEIRRHSVGNRVCSVRFFTAFHRKRTERIFPVFLPFLGCPGHCVYCAQDRQTGQSAAEKIPAVLARAALALADFPSCAPGEERELAFYGGTFTALPPDDRRLCLAFLERMRREKRITRARCSTRPDALDPAVLQEIAAAGISLVELGIQSFDDHALQLSRRGYDGRTAAAGCRAVTDAGLQLGIQLLPGMPGSSPEVFLEDVQRALSFRPACLRFYPCLVPDGTVLARWFREGTFAPWTTEQTVQTLGRALRLAWRQQIPVIRLSVAPEPAFDAALLAGPRHPALGALIQAEALLLATEDAVARLGRAPERLVLPGACQGFMYGDRGVLKERWRSLGLGPERIVFDAKADMAELF